MPKGAALPRAKLKYPSLYYTPYSLHEWPEKELRQEYTRLRDIAVKRLKRMGQDPDIAQSQEYRYYSSRVPRLRDMIDRLEIEEALADVALFVRNPEISTLGGVRERLRQQAEGFRQTVGDDLPNVATLQEWTYYAKSEGLLEIYPSDEVIEYYYVVGGDRNKLNRDAFKKWADTQAYWTDRGEAGPEEESGSDDL